MSPQQKQYEIKKVVELMDASRKSQLEMMNSPLPQMPLDDDEPGDILSKEEDTSPKSLKVTQAVIKKPSI